MTVLLLIIYCLGLALLKVVLLLISIAYFTLAERKIMGAIHRRRGPNTEGFWGVLQPVFDGVKLIFKELVIPTSANKRIFMLAPFIILIISLSSWTLMPFYVFEPLNSLSSEVLLNGLMLELPVKLVTLVHTDIFVFAGLVANLELVNYLYYFESLLVSSCGLLLLLAFSSLNVYSIIVAGWASSSKYAFLGALRSASQMVSYEVALSIVVLSIVTLIGTFDLTTLVWVQTQTVWFVFPLLPIFIIFFIAALAETNRAPFDLPEAEAELVAGYNVEYSAIIFAMFFLAEYCNIILMSLFAALAFFGGWDVPFITSDSSILNSLILSIKTIFFCVLFIIVRASFPRYRYDQLMDLGWKVLMPIATGFFIFEIGFLWTLQFLPLPGNSLPPTWYEGQAFLNVYEYSFQGFFYYFITSSTLFSALLVLILGHPVHSLLALICSFIQISILLILNKVEYFGFVFLIVYVGAVSILFLFILMLFDLSVAFQHRYLISFKKKLFTLSLVLTLLKIYFIFTARLELFYDFYVKKVEVLLGQRLLNSLYLNVSEIFPVSLHLYKTYGISFFFITILLLSAMIGSITIATQASTGFFRLYTVYTRLNLLTSINMTNFNFLTDFTSIFLIRGGRFSQEVLRIIEIPEKEGWNKDDKRRVSWYTWNTGTANNSTTLYSLRTIRKIAAVECIAKSVQLRALI